MDWFARDLRFTFRTLAKSPLFTLVAVLSLALGVGANTAIFTLTDQVLLRLLPVPDPEKLVQIRITGGRFGSNNGDGIRTLSHPLFLDLREKNTVLSGLMARYPVLVSLRSGDTTEMVQGELVSGDYFEVLGVQPALGRLLTPDDDRSPLGHPLAVLSHRFWTERYGGDPGVVGRTLSLNGVPMTVIGVSQEGFEGVETGFSVAVRVPITMKARMTPTWDDLKNRRSAWLHAFGRLKPGVSRQEAESSMKVLYRQIQQLELQEPHFARADDYGRRKFLEQKFELIPASRGQSYLRERTEQPLLLLTVLVGLVLLIACANLAGLLLARATARQREIAVRFALGAGRWQVVRVFLIESLLLAGAGGLLGLCISVWTCGFLLRFVPPSVATMTLSAMPDGRVLAFTAAVSLLAALLFGLTPALQATTAGPAGTLKDLAGSVTGSGRHVRLRKILVASQVAVALLLAASAGLFTRSLNNLKSLRPGFRTERLITFTVDPSLNGYPPAQRLRFFFDLVERLRAMPGVEAASASSHRLLTGGRWDSSISVEGYQSQPGENMNPYMMAVTPGYFETIGIPLLGGRDFQLKDLAGQSRIAVVNQEFVNYYFKGRSPLGRRFAMGGGPNVKPDTEIVGVVADAKYTSLRETNQRQVFHPVQRWEQFVGRMTVYVRTRRDAESMFGAVRKEVQRLDPRLSLYDMRTLETQLDNSLANDRLIAFLSGAFSVLATLLAAIGLYGVLAYLVTSRTREIGIRMALGAGRGQVLWLLMREVAFLAGAGCVAGLAAELALARLVRSQLYQVEPADPATLVAACLAITAIAALAGYLPVRRATRLQPMRALRYE